MDAAAIDAKMIARYEIAISKHARCWRKKQGRAAVHLLRYRLFYLLLASEGRHCFYEHEANIKDARVTPDAAREGARERGRADRRGREGVDPARAGGLTTIPWWLPSGREVSGTEHFPGRLAREPSDPAKRLRAPVLWLWLFR